MYKDDNYMARDGSSEALLRMMLDGNGNRPTARQNTPPCNQESPCANSSTWGLVGHPLASVYSPLQEFEDLYDLDTALKEGTVFSKLNLPFMGRRIDKGGKCCG